MTVLERLGHDVVFPEEQTCCGQMHLNSRLPRRGARARRGGSCGSSASTTRSSRRRRRASATVRELYRERVARAGAAARRVLRAVRAPRRAARRRRRRRLVPAPRRLPPDVPLAARDARRRRAAAAAARRARAGARGAARRRRVLRLRRHVRDQERGHLERDARRQVRRASRRAAPRSAPRVDSSCLLHIGGGLCAARRARCAPLHLAEILAVASDARRASPRRRATSSRTRSCARTSRNATDDDPRASAPRVVDEVPDWEELREAGRAIKARRARATSTSTCCEFEAAVEAAGGHVHWARDAAEANADRRRASRARTAPTRW